MAGGPDQCSICLEDLDDGGEPTLACGHRFHAACLAQMAGAVGTGTTRRGALTACPNCRTVSRVALTPVAAFGVGDRVEALWGQKWYPGEVDAVVDGGRAYEIIWDDGDEGEVRAAHVRAAPAPVRPVPPARTVATPGRPEGVDSSDDDEDDHASPRAPERRRGGARTTSSRFWGVSWHRRGKKWRAQYRDADGKDRCLGLFDDDEEAARAVNKAIRDAGLENKRRVNAVDATGALVPRKRSYINHSAVVAPDPVRDPTATTSKFWGVHWDQKNRRWQAYYKDANGKHCSIGRFNTEAEAAHAVNAAISALPPDVQRRRHSNPVVDGQLVPRALKAPGHGPPRKSRKRRREKPAAAALSTRPRN